MHLKKILALKKPVADGVIVDNAVLSAEFNSLSFSCSVPKGRTLLRALLEEGAEIPYSCESGVCGTCKAKLLKGEVQMESFAALTKAEVDSGLVLTCQAKPKSENVEIKVS